MPGQRIRRVVTGGGRAREEGGVSIRHRHLDAEEMAAGDGHGQSYARIRYDDGSELHGWVGGASCTAHGLRSQLSGLRIRIGHKVECDGTRTPVVYWPPRHVYMKAEDVYNSTLTSPLWLGICVRAAAHAACAAVFLPTERDGILGPALEPAFSALSALVRRRPSSKRLRDASSPARRKSNEGSLVGKKEAIASELELSGSMKAVATGAARDLGLNTEGMSIPEQIQACYDQLFEAPA